MRNAEVFVQLYHVYMTNSALQINSESLPRRMLDDEQVGPEVHGATFVGYFVDDHVQVLARKQHLVSRC